MSSHPSQSSIKDHFPVVAKAKSLSLVGQPPPSKRVRLNLNPQHLPSSDDSVSAPAPDTESPTSPAPGTAATQQSPPPSPPRRKTRLATRLQQLNARAAAVTATPLPPRPSESLIPTSTKPNARKRKIQLVLDDDQVQGELELEQEHSNDKQVKQGKTITDNEAQKDAPPATPTRKTAAGSGTPVNKTPILPTHIPARVANALAKLDSPRRGSPAVSSAPTSFQFSPRPPASGPATPISAAERLLSMVPSSSGRNSPLKSSPGPIASKPSSLRARLDKLNAKASTPLPTTPRSSALATTPPSSSPSTRLIDTLPHIQDLLPTGGAAIRSSLPRASSSSSVGPSASLRILSSTLESDPYLAKIPLPDHLTHLVSTFKALETVVWYNLSRGDQSVLVHMAKAVQAQCNRRFDAEVLGKILAVFPDAYTVQGVKTRNPNNVGPDLASVCVEFNPEWDANGAGEHKQQGPRPVTDLLITDKPKRLTCFRQRVIDLVAAAHNQWMRAQGMDARAWASTNKRDAVAFWHPEFDLDAHVPEVAPAELPAYMPVHLGPNVKHLIPTAGEMRTQRLAREAAARDAAAAVDAAQGGAVGGEAEAGVGTPEKKKLSVAERAQQLRDRMAARESAAKALTGASVPPEVKHRLLVLSRVVLVANTIFTFFQMKSKPVVSLRDLADAVHRSSPAIMSIDSAIDHITVLTDIAPACFEMVKIGIVRHVRKGDAAALALIKEAVEREKARLQQQAAAGAVEIKGAAGRLLMR